MKTILSLTLLFALLLKMGGFYTILSFEREEIREKMEQKILKSINKTDLVCIIENADNSPKIEWERLEKEFSFEGNLYDVVYTEKMDGMKYYYCLSDKDETKLEAKIDKLLETQNQHSPFGNHSKLLLDFLSQPLIYCQNPTFYFKYFIHKKPSISSNLAILHTSNYVSTLKQPPQFS